LHLDAGAWTPRQAVVASVHDQSGPLDQVVAVYFPGPRSATGEDLVEICCHGSPYIQKKILSALMESGAQPARPGEFTQRAFLNGRLDLAQAEAVCDLIAAGTEAAHRTALRQLQGGLSREIARLRRPILDSLVELEAGLDHPEEDIPACPAHEAAVRFLRLAEPIGLLADTFRSGRLLREGARICIVGRPNAGKSSLLNALLGCDRAIVCEEPGTTRDTIEEPCDLGGLPALLIDTAGLGLDPRSPADAASLLRTDQALNTSDLTLLLIDGARPQTEGDAAVHRSILESSARHGRQVLTVLSKSDLGPRPQPGLGADCTVSSRDGCGLPELRRLLRTRLAPDHGRPSASDTAVTSQRHHDALRRCGRELRAAAAAADRQPGCWEELAARHLRDALAALDEVTGPAAPDELLQEIFSRFCLGK
jgi:tRNA modification GTPase